MALALTFEGVYKTYRNGVHALKGLNLKVARGEFFGLLGLNGAGKTTSIQIIAGSVRPTAGRVCVHGLDVVRRYRQAHRLVGIAPQEIVLDLRFLNVRQILIYNAGYFGIPRRKAAPLADRLLDDFGLGDKRQASVQELSGGMKRRLLLAKALIHDPQLLVLDEPTAGADVALRHHIWDRLIRLKRQGKTILLTTHYLEEAQRLCDRVGILHHGVIQKAGAPKELMRALGPDQLTFHLDPPLSRVPAGIGARFSPTLKGHKLIVSGNLGDPEVVGLIQQLAELGHRVVSIEQTGAQLEDVFLDVMGSSTQGVRP